MENYSEEYSEFYVIKKFEGVLRPLLGKFRSNNILRLPLLLGINSRLLNQNNSSPPLDSYSIYIQNNLNIDELNLDILFTYQRLIAFSGL